MIIILFFNVFFLFRTSVFRNYGFDFNLSNTEFAFCLISIWVWVFVLRFITGVLKSISKTGFGPSFKRYTPKSSYSILEIRSFYVIPEHRARYDGTSVFLKVEKKNLSRVQTRNPKENEGRRGKFKRRRNTRRFVRWRFALTWYFLVSLSSRSVDVSPRRYIINECTTCSRVTYARLFPDTRLSRSIIRPVVGESICGGTFSRGTAGRARHVIHKIYAYIFLLRFSGRVRLANDPNTLFRRRFFRRNTMIFRYAQYGSPLPSIFYSSDNNITYASVSFPTPAQNDLIFRDNSIVISYLNRIRDDENRPLFSSL